MLRTNLSTRPFYNERAVLVAIAALVFLTVALGAFNAAQILSLTSRNGELVARAEASESKATDLRAQARTTQQALNREEVKAVQAAAREANELIDRRAFSWTTLFNQFEETLPPDVRIVMVTPQVDSAGRMLVAVTTIARRADDLDSFLDRLNETGSFSGVIARTDETLEDGSTRAVLQGYYSPVPRAVPAGSPRPSSDPNNVTPGNQSPPNAPPSAGGPR
jgi:hypothetical protein